MKGVSIGRTQGPWRQACGWQVHTSLLSPGAWIITGGSHTGVMKQVGEAVRDFTLSSGCNEGEVVTVGIATWGTVHNREGLIHPSVSSATSPGLGAREVRA